MRRQWGALAVIVLVAISGCSGDDGGGDDGGSAAEAEAPEAQAAPDDLIAAIEQDGGGADCDPLDPRAGLPEAGMPVNADGVVADPTEWNRNDGFSPGTALLTQVPGVDLEASGLPAITDVPDSLEDDSPVVVVDAETGDRWPVWAELDSG